MSYNYPLPDGSVISVPDGTPTSVAAAWARRDFPELYKSKEEKKQKEGFFANVGKGASDAASALDLGIGSLGNEQAARERARKAQAEENVKTVGTQDIQDAYNQQGILAAAGKVPAFIRDQVASSLPQMGATAAGAMAGGAMGGPLGALAGGLAANLPLMYGSNLQRQLQESPDKAFDKSAAAAAAVPQAALDALPALFFLKKMGVTKLGGSAIEALTKETAEQAEKKLLEAAKRSYAANAARGAGQGMLAEMPTEVAQAVLERAQAGLPLLTAEAGREYFDNAAAAAAAGGVFGGVGGAREVQSGRGIQRGKDKAAADEARALADSQEEARKQAEEAKKQTPEYLTQLDQQYKERQAKLAELKEAVNAFGKPDENSAEALQKKQAREAVRAHLAATEGVLKEYTARKKEIDSLNERQGMTADEYWHFKNYGIKPERLTETAAPTELGPDEAAAQQQPKQPAPPPDPAVQAQQTVEKALAPVRFQKEQTGEDLTAEEIVGSILQSPEATKAALFALENKLPILGLDKDTSRVLLKDVKEKAAAQVKEQQQKERAALQQEQADLVTQATQATQTTEVDPLAALKDSMGQLTDNDLTSFEDTYRALGLDVEGAAQPGYLDGMFEKALGRGSNTGPRKVAVPEGVKPITNPESVLQHVDTLYAGIDAANKAMDVARAARNNVAAEEAARQREKAETALLRLTESTPVAGGIIAQRKQQDEALNRAAWLLEDLSANRVLGSKNDDARGSASSTPETLKHQVEAARSAYIQAVIQEAAINRMAFGQPLTEKEALQAAANIQRVFNEWMTRAAALPSSAVKEERMVSPAQMRGTEIIKGAEYEKVDPRPLRERKFGSFRAATEVLQDQIKRIVAPLVSVPDAGKRVEPLLKTQFESVEAGKTAEARGDFATTRGEQLNKRRQYVAEQIDRALARGAIPPVQRALRAAKDAIEQGRGSTDVVSGVEGQRFTAGLLDSAGELASRVINRQLERAYLDKLVREVTGALKPGTTEDANQGNLFDPAPIVKQQKDSKARIEKLQAQVDELKAGRHQSLKEGVSAAKRIRGLEKAIAILQDDKKQRLDVDAREAKKDFDRLQGDIAFTRATAANFAKAPEVKAGRQAVETTRAIKAEWDALDKETDKKLGEATRKFQEATAKLEEANARLSDFAWMKTARNGGEDLVVSGQFSEGWPLPPVTGLVLDEQRVAEQAALKKEQAALTKTLEPKNKQGAPLTVTEEAEKALRRQSQAVDALYAQLSSTAMQVARATAVTPEMAARRKKATETVKAAIAWIDTLDADWKKSQSDTRNYANAALNGGLWWQAEGFPAHLKAAYEKRMKVNADMRQEIDAASSRMEAAMRELGDIQEEAANNFDPVAAVVEAASDKRLQFQKKLLQDYADLFTQRGFVVDLDKLTVSTKTGTAVPPLQAQLRTQQQAVERAETNFAEEAARLRVQQERLGLGGTRVTTRTDRYGRRITETERIPSITEREEEQQTRREEQQAQAAKEATERREFNDAAKAMLQSEIDTLTKQADAKRAEIQAAPKSKTKKLEKELQEILARLSAEKLALDNVGKRRVFRQQPIMTKQSAAPITMRTGSPESAAATLAARASIGKLSEREQAARDDERALFLVGKDARTAAEERELQAIQYRRINRTAAAIKGKKTTKKEKVEADKDEAAAQKRSSRLQDAVGDMDEDTLFRTATTAEETLAPDTAKRVMDAYLKDAPESIKSAIKFFASAKDIPTELLQQLQREGGVDADGRVIKGGLLGDGTIVIVGDSHTNVADLMETLAHEVTGHYGVRKLLGKEGITDLTQRLSSAGLIDSTAQKLGVEAGLRQARETSRQLGESKQKADERAVQEILAHLEEKRPSEGTLQKLGRFINEFIGAINAALTRMGLRSPYKATPSDLYHILRQARKGIEAKNDSDGQTVFRKPKTEYASPAIGDAAELMIGGQRDKVAEIRAAATGLHFRTRFVDNYAALKEALKRGDPTMAIQVTYDLMTFAQRNHLVQQAVMEGPPVRTKSTHRGKDVRMTEAQEGGPTLKRVSALLGKIEGYGNAQAVSDAFTMLAMAKRAQSPNMGWERVFADLPTPSNATEAQAAEIRTTNAQRAKARAEADKLAADLDAGTSPFADAYKEYQKWNKGMLQFALQAGVIKEEDFRRLTSTQNYTPLFRADKHGNLVLDIAQGRDITVGRLADEPHLQKLIGGSGQVMDFFTASVRNASLLIDASLHNIASREAAFSLNALGIAHPVAESEKGSNIIEFRKDGDLQRFAIDTSNTPAADIPTDLLVKGFAGVPASLPGFVRLMGVPATILRRAVTRNPLYMARQLVRDPTSAWLATGAQFNPLTDTLKELGTALSGNADKTLDRRGITGGVMFAENETDMQRIQDEARSQGNGRNIGYYSAKLDHAAMAADAVTRRNVYNGAIKAGASDIEATIAAYESMPFSKRGTSPSVRYMNHMVPFLSAAIQGWDVLYRSVKGDMPLNELVNVRNQLLARGAMIAGMTMVYAMAMADDEEYQKANTSERLSNWFVTLPGTDQRIKVPVPFELGIIFKMLPEAMVRIAYSDKNAASELRDVGGALANMVPNVAVPQAMLPAVEAMLNKSFYTGNAIEGRALAELDIGQRYDAKTSELSKLLGFDFDLFSKQVGISPKMLEYVMGQYTAGLYPAMAALIDNLLPAPSVSKPDRKLAEMPVFRSALLQEDAGGEVNRLYDKIEKFTKASATLKHLQETEPEKAQAYFEDNKDDVVKGAMAGKMKAAIDKISNAENKIRNSTMTAEQKREALDNFKKVKSNLATQFSAYL